MAIQVVLSPSKLLQEDGTKPRFCKITIPSFISNSKQLAKDLLVHDVSFWEKKLGVKREVAEKSMNWLMHVSRADFNTIASPAACMFQGEAFKYLQAESFSKQEWDWASKNLFILSGLYGILRATDAVLPYRLMIGTPVSGGNAKNLYDYWHENVNTFLNAYPRTNRILNCASEEYSKVLDRQLFPNQIIDVQFLQRKGKELKQIATISKQSRGAMARFVIQNKISKTESLFDFQEMGYSFEESRSTENNLVFVR
jgi:cytoplasmic iron level regulating protein YaaA (DUF328/UPF0246 family)